MHINGIEGEFTSWHRLGYINCNVSNAPLGLALPENVQYNRLNAMQFICNLNKLYAIVSFTSEI